MTRSDYASEITTIIDDQTGGVEYPDSFDGDVEACFLARMPVEQAAAKLQADWFGEPVLSCQDCEWTGGEGQADSGANGCFACPKCHAAI